MPISLDNLDWMIFNSLLAIIPVFAGLLTVYSRHIVTKLFFGTMWLLFVPNTIYILTDIKHIPFNMSRATSEVDLLFLFFQYVVFICFGIFSFLFAVYPIEYMFLASYKKKKRVHLDIFLFLLNFIIAFGVILGRVQRTNSWEVITDFEKVVVDVISTISSAQLLVFVVIFGIIANTLYFSLRDTTASMLSSLLPEKKKK